jgi:hypothetical protein
MGPSPPEQTRLKPLLNFSSLIAGNTLTNFCNLQEIPQTDIIANQLSMLAFFA